MSFFTPKDYFAFAPDLLAVEPQPNEPLVKYRARARRNNGNLLEISIMNEVCGDGDDIDKEETLGRIDRLIEHLYELRRVVERKQE